MRPYTIIEKAVGETPLSAMEAWREKNHIAKDIPLTYAGRLDPMASGTLLVLIGDTCKDKGVYLGLDKQYEFDVLFGLGSDTHDVLGRLTKSDPILFDDRVVTEAAKELTGTIELPYPHFSSKTVQGKPLHTWSIEGRLGEITIPTKTSQVYALRLEHSYTKTRSELYAEASKKIESIPPVTELRKAIGNDFRREDVRSDWRQFQNEGNPDDLFYLARFTCIASSGTYMRSLATALGARLDCEALAYSIHRTTIGNYQEIPFGGFWWKRYR